jgi:hypothetical protein
MPGDSVEDCHPSLNQLTGYKPGDQGLPDQTPWKAAPPTLVGSTLMVVRLAEARVIRPLLAFELMQLIGWHRTAWNREERFSSQSDMPPSSLCTELAGNAFSAFAVLPLASSLVACTGAISQLREDLRKSAMAARVAQPPPSRARQLRATLSCSSYGSE